MNILMWNPFRKRHPAALSGTAICPFCFGTKVKLRERLGPFMYRWQCKKCFQIFREDVSPLGRFEDDPKKKEHWVGTNPYASFRQGLRPMWQIRKHHFRKPKPKPETNEGT